MTQHVQHRSSRTEVLRALLNIAWTGAIVVGAPLLLARTFGYPLPHEMPDWGEVFSTPLQLVDPHVIVNACAVLGWITWSIVVVYVLVDIVDLARGVGHRVRRIGPASVVAGKLVASVALILSLLRQQPIASVPTARPATVEQVVEATPAMAITPINVTLASATHLALPVQTAAPAAAPTAAPMTKTYAVQRGDSLWRIAEQQLGDGFRWREIHQLNRDLITNPDLICSGWILTLPDDIAPAIPATSGLGDAPVPSAPTAIPTDQQQPAVAESAPTPPKPTDGGTAHTTTTPPVLTSVVPDVASTASPPDTAIKSEQPPVTLDTPAPTGETKSPTTTSPAPPSPGTAATTEPTEASGLPLWLRALGFNSRADYDAWVNAHPEVRNAPAPGSDASDSETQRNSLAALAASTFAAGIVAAAVTRSLDRRRHRILNRRPVHAPLPPRDPALRPTEHTFRTNTSADPAHQLICIDTVLRYLSRELRGPNHGPNLLLVRAIDDGVELLWEAAPTSVLPARFVDQPPGSWLFPYPDSSDLEELQFELIGERPYSESLVTLGDTREGPVLVNLSALDTLDVTGDRGAVDAWLASAELELEAHSWATHTDARNARSSQGDARITTAIYIADDGTAHPYVQIQDRSEDATPASWTLDLGQRAAQLAHRDSDLALDITPVGVDPDLARLGTLLLLEADFDPYQSQVDDLPDGEDLEAPHDDDTDRPSPGMPTGGSGSTAPPAPPEPASPPTIEGTSTATAGAGARLTGTLLMETEPDTIRTEPGTDASDDHECQPGLRVTLLGRPTVTGWTTQPKGNRADEIVVYLAAARPDSVHRDRLMEALWNGERVKPKALFNHLAAIRRHADDPEIILTASASYRLAESVRSDWDEFRAFADHASDLDGRERLDCLRQAVELVQGRPFDFADGNYGWASGEGIVSRIEVTVTDLAAVLAREAIDAGDVALAVFAARKGLLSCPWLLRLYGYIIEAHSLDGSNALVEHTWREMLRAAGDDNLPSEVIASYEAAKNRTAGA